MSRINDPDRVAHALMSANLGTLEEYVPSIHHIRDEIFEAIKNNETTRQEYFMAYNTVMSEKGFKRCLECHDWFEHEWDLDDSGVCRGCCENAEETAARKQRIKENVDEILYSETAGK